MRCGSPARVTVWFTGVVDGCDECERVRGCIMKIAMKATAPTALRTTLPARCYVDPAWFAVEMERLFARMWICVGRMDALAARTAPSSAATSRAPA